MTGMWHVPHTFSALYNNRGVEFILEHYFTHSLRARGAELQARGLSFHCEALHVVSESSDHRQVENLEQLVEVPDWFEVHSVIEICCSTLARVI